MQGCRRTDEFHALVANRNGELVEEPLATAQQCGDDRQVQLVDQARTHELLNRRRTARDLHVPTAGSVKSPTQHPVRIGIGDEVEGRAASHGE